jgi:protein SCO1/2
VTARGIGLNGMKIICIVAIGLSLFGVGCRAPAARQEASSPPAKRFDLKGKVISIDRSAKQVTIDHEDIPGFMGAMTMPYAVKDDRALERLAPNDLVTAKVVVSSDGSNWLEEIVVTKPAPAAAPGK